VIGSTAPFCDDGVGSGAGEEDEDCEEDWDDIDVFGEDGGEEEEEGDGAGDAIGGDVGVGVVSDDIVYVCRVWCETIRCAEVWVMK